MSANHRERHVRVQTGRGHTTVTVGPGQLLMGRKSAAESLHMAEPMVRRRLKKLEDDGRITRKAAGHFSIVTVLNWPEYQHTEESERPGKGQAKAGQRPGTGQAQATNKNGKKEKKRANGKKDEGRRDEQRCSSCSWSAEEIEKVRALANLVAKKMPVDLGARPDNRDLTLKACYLVAAGVLPENWLWDAVEAVSQGAPKRNGAAYWFRCLETGARQRGEAIRLLLAGVHVPEALAVRSEPCAS